VAVGWATPGAPRSPPSPRPRGAGDAHLSRPERVPPRARSGPDSDDRSVN